MKLTKTSGVFEEKNRIFTENLESCKNIKVYDEKLINSKSRQLRSWNPYKSKLAAAILKGLEVKIEVSSDILYLGAATGTTVSHISDIAKEGTIYSVEISPFSIKNLVELSQIRRNIIPILEDAYHPDRYKPIVSYVDLVYQDISQKNQAEIFTENVRSYLKKNGSGILMVKSRSIDISLKPKKTYEIVSKKLEDSGLKLEEIIDLAPYEKDHAAIRITV
ncbi:MAG: fibrillarin-like rRNA/tRNA 2'-O-methyltransferase [Thermoplasmatales archaeon]|nr:MAG: fibrillarin-like rRNA/tRNA 2'-O-methyltransferase [Thermoplasmatales archaeon]